MYVKNSCYIVLLLFCCTGIYANAQQLESPLIPLPQHVNLGKGRFVLNNELLLVAKDSLKIKREIKFLREWLSACNVRAKVSTENVFVPHIELRLTPVEAPNNNAEAYHLLVTKNKILIEANEAKGVFYALQTLKQLVSGKSIPTGEIKDWPAFSWRGYLVDVGRNFQSMELLKQQIDVMAAYKLNVFHFHFTEDLAWRLASKQYPQLTDRSNMLRWPGKYYTQQDFKTLIDYCKERHITLIPEIDMPGHSGAFQRAMKAGMQTPQGIIYLKHLLREFCDSYDVPYIHIGGDEVKITNKQFLPDMTAYLEGLGKQTIGWEPGGNLSKSTIRQLWMGGPNPITDSAAYCYIDSKHLYINHMDPLETVVTLFNRQIGEQEKGNKQLLGGILCSWPDRAVANEKDVFLQNAVYPALLTFAERSWRGGGQSGWVCNIGDPYSDRAQAFRQFEDRLLVHKERYFKGKPFPYVRQTGLVWNFYGPYPNKGDLDSAFEPEIDKQETGKLAPTFKAEGGTLILRHWWADILKGLISKPEEYTTWYARTRIWSDKNEEKPFWIGFDNLSRSYASNSPAINTWDNRVSKVWVNNQLISPPNWKQAGMKGDLETPMIDEGYSFRAPTIINLKKGWNEVLIKLPIGNFKGEDWQNPVKWMFTFVPLFY